MAHKARGEGHVFAVEGQVALEKDDLVASTVELSKQRTVRGRVTVPHEEVIESPRKTYEY